MVVTLLRAGVDVNAPATLEPSAFPPLFVALLQNQEQIVSMLITLGADVNQVAGENLWSPLIMSTMMRNEWCVRKLLGAGANINVLSGEGRSALFYACEKGLTGIVRAILDYCALPVDSPVTQESSKSTGLHVAAIFNQPAVICLLLDYGANPDKKDKANRTPLQVAEQCGSHAARTALNTHPRIAITTPSQTYHR